MNDALYIGRALGFPIRVHRFFLYMLVGLSVYVALTPAMFGILPLVLIVFGLVLAHELGHAVVARRLGIHVVDIVLWPLGGMARMADIPEDSRTEGLVAIAGPLVNIVLAFAGMVVLFLTLGIEGLTAGSLSPSLAWAYILRGFVGINLMLGLFNLVPAFPMDGGRLLRAYLGRSGDWVVATERAVRVGRIVAWAMILFGIVYGQWVLPIIAVYILFAGTRELWATRLRHMGGAPSFAGASGGARAGSLADLFNELAKRAREQAAARGRGVPPGGPGPPPGPPPSPNVAPEPEPPVTHYELQDDGPDAGAPPPSGGFSEEDIERLERFRGRLKRRSE